MAKQKRKNGIRAAQMYGPRLVKRYTLPDYCDCQSIVMRELDGKDELEAAIWADQNKSSVLEGTMAAFQADQRESIRLSIVQVDDVAVNVDGAPFREMNEWSFRTMRFVREFFADLNGVEEGDLKNAVTGAEIMAESTPGREREEDEDVRHTAA